MQLKSFRILLLVSLSLAVASCGTPGPMVTLCVSDPAKIGFQCVTPDKKSFYLSYSESNNYVAMSPQDFRITLDWMKQCASKQKLR